MSDAPLIVAAARTPVGTAGHALAGVDAASLAAPVLARLAGDVPAGRGGAGQLHRPGGDVARVATLTAGLAYDVPALTVDRQCGSGLAAIEVAAALVRSTGAAGASRAVSSRRRPPRGGSGRRPATRPRCATSGRPSRPRTWATPRWGWPPTCSRRSTASPARRRTRYAARSHVRAWTAQQAGMFRRRDRPGRPVSSPTSDRRAGMTADRLARLRPAFRPDGTVTAGNACGINDGAAAVAVVPGRLRPARPADPGHGHRPASTRTGPGSGIVPAVRTALDRAGLRAGRHRRRRAQRGLRRTGARLLRRARPRSRTRLPRGRRAGAGAPVGSERRDPRGAALQPADARRPAAATGWPRSPSAAGRAWPWWWSRVADRLRRRLPPVRRPAGRVRRHRAARRAPDRRDRRQRLGQVDVRAHAQRPGRADDRHGARGGPRPGQAGAARCGTWSASASPTRTRRS